MKRVRGEYPQKDWRALIPIPDEFVEGNPPRLRRDADHKQIDRIRRGLDERAPAGYILRSEELVEANNPRRPTLPGGVRYGLVRIYERGPTT